MLKVIKINNDSQLIKQSLKKDRSAQKQLFDKYAPKMLNMCCYYIKDFQQAEEVMLSGFFNVFTKLEQYANKGSFEGWIRKIMVRESINFLRQKKGLIFTDQIELYNYNTENEIEFSIAVEDLHFYINQLSHGCKIVFNLYVIEGYKHSEIANMLGVTEGTSKTQLSRARKALQRMLSSNKRKYHGTK